MSNAGPRSANPGRARRLAIGAGLVLLLAVLALGSIVARALRNPSYREMSKEVLRADRLAPRDSNRSFLNFHGLLDGAVFSLGRLAGPELAYFRAGVQSRTFAEHLTAVVVELPERFEVGTHELRARTLEGTMEPAFRILQWHSNTAPTLIHNHGASQIPFDGVFASIFDTGDSNRRLKVNLIVVRAPFHKHSRGELTEAASTLSRFLAIMAVSVRVTEHLVQAVRKRGSRIVGVTGISLGGFVANRHHLAYNSATYYVPVAAGTAFADVFLRTSPAHPSALRESHVLEHHLSFADEWARADNANVFPILGRFDRVSRLERQGPSYGTSQLEIWDTGHVTTALAFRSLRHAFLRHALPKTELEADR